MSSADIGHVERDLRLTLFHLNGAQRESAADPLERVPSGPQMSCYRPFRHIKAFRQLSRCLWHVAILALLRAESGLIEILTPFEEGLGLLADNAFAVGMAERASNRGLDFLVLHRRVGRCDSIRPSDPAIGREVARGAGDASFLIGEARFWIVDFRCVNISILERLGLVADIALPTIFLAMPGIKRPRINPGAEMRRGSL